jgi:hypothetical protein
VAKSIGQPLMCAQRDGDPKSMDAATAIVPTRQTAPDIVINSPANGQQGEDTIEAKLADLHKELAQAFMSRLDRSLRIARFVELAEELKICGHSGQKSRVGRPESGIARAARQLVMLGPTPEARRKMIDRALKIAAISAQVQTAAVEAGLGNTASALLEIALQETPEHQLAKVTEIVERRRTLRVKLRTAATGAHTRSPHDPTIGQSAGLFPAPRVFEVQPFTDGFVALTNAWRAAPAFRAVWNAASPAQRQQFATEVLEVK